MKKNVFIPIILGMVLLLLASSCGQKKEAVAPSGKVQKPAEGPASAEKQEELPNIVPYLDAKPSALDGQGQAEVNPKGPFTVSSIVDFKITFTVGEAGIAPGGFVILQISPWWGWSPPQQMNPGAEGFITVTPSFKDPGLLVKVLSMQRVLVFPGQGRIKEGETITFTYRQAQVDQFAEAAELFMIFVDADGDGHCACIANPPAIRTTAGVPVRLVVSAPSITQPGDTVHISAAPLDMAGNWGIFPAGEFTCSVRLNGKPTADSKVTAAGSEKNLAFNYKLPGPGVYFFQVKGPNDLAGKSNVSFCQEGKPGLTLYFGDIHGHSRFSDGTGTPGDYYSFARYVSGLDIAALTDHADYGMLPFAGKIWEQIKAAANSRYVPGQFVTFAGYEWTNWTYGHRNVYYRDGDGPVFRAIDKNTDTPQKLWQLLAPYDAMTIGHHVGGGPIPVDWSIPPVTQGAHGPQEMLVEICSVHGSSEYYGCEAGIYHAEEGHFVRDALLRGYKLGIIGSGDTHDGHPGQRSVNAPVTGILAVYATELTRDAVWDALKARRVYATSGPKIILNFRVGNAPMGSEVSWSKAKGPLPIAVRTVCCEDIQRIEVIRSGEILFRETGEKIGGVYTLLLIEDPEPLQGTSWYYVRVLQKDGNMAWSSPVWVEIKP